MSEGIIHEIARERDDILDVQRLIEAVRGSLAAKILFVYRPGHCFDTLCGSSESESSATPTPELNDEG